MQPQPDPLTLGVVLALLGMGGTLLVLYLLGLIVSLLKRLFPIEPPPSAAASPNGSPREARGG